MNIFKIHINAAFVLYIVLDMFLVGMGMGVPFFCILFGFPVGWYIVKRLKLSKMSLNDILSKTLKYALLTSFFTFLLMIIIWGPISALLLNPNMNFANFGMPLILYEPKISFIGWIILMVFISPVLQLFTTIFASYLTLWNVLNGNKNILKLIVNTMF